MQSGLGYLHLPGSLFRLYSQSDRDDWPRSWRLCGANDRNTELVPQSPDTFFMRGGLSRDTFVRDASGKVTENRGYGADSGPTAAAYRAKKVK